MSEQQVGQIMAKWAYIGVIAGLIGTYAYLDVLKYKKEKLLVASLFTIGGLALGGYIGAREVEKLKNR